MATLRNEKTEAGKEMWRKVDQAALRAPDWVQSHINTLAAQHVMPVHQIEEKHSNTPAKQPK